MLEDLARLIAIEEIKNLKARYFRCVDTKDWSGLRSVFTDDAVLEIPENFENPFGPDDFVEMVAAALANAVSVHHGHMPEIEILSDDRARAIWAMNDLLLFPPGDAGLVGACSIVGDGHYHETYQRADGNWRIASLRLTRLRLQSTGQMRSVV